MGHAEELRRQVCWMSLSAWNIIGRSQHIHDHHEEMLTQLTARSVNMNTGKSCSGLILVPNRSGPLVLANSLYG